MPFPISPISGQVYSLDNKSWVWDTVKWDAVVPCYLADPNSSIIDDETEEDTEEEIFVDDWVRNPDWLALPILSTSEQKVVVLLAITNDDSNFTAFNCAGNYTVDWGDGNIENFSSGVTAQHLYSYSSISSSTEFELITGLIARQVIITITPQVGSNLTSVDFQRKYTTSPQGYNSNFLDISINGPNLTSLVFSIPNVIFIGMEWVEQVNIGVIGTVTSLNFIDFKSLRSVILNNFINFTSTFQMFNGCSSIKSVPFFNTSFVTNMESMFSNCYSLKSVPLLDTSSVTNMSYMFSSCYSIESVPLFDTASVTNMSYMFNNSSIEKIPLFNTSNVLNMEGMLRYTFVKTIPLIDTASVTNMKYMFSTTNLISLPLLNTGSVVSMYGMFEFCENLKQLPLFNTSSVTDMRYMFYNCTVLESVPLFDTSSVTMMNYMFYNCNALKSVPLFNMSSVTSVYYMFSSCEALSSVPPFNTISATTMSYMFSYCSSLKSCPFLNTSSCLYMDSMFEGCISLVSVPSLNVSSAIYSSSLFYIFSSCRSLASAPLSGTKISISYSSCKLSRSALVSIFQGLATVVGRTITITNNPGTSSLTNDDLIIASQKGWTVSF